MLTRQTFARILFAAALAGGWWVGIGFAHGQGTAGAKPSHTPQPTEIVGFEGFLIGSITSADGKGCVLKVTEAIATAGSKATDPSIVVGKDTRLSYIAYGPNKDAQYTPDAELAAAVTGLLAQGKPIMVRVFAAKPVALMINKVWPGDGDPKALIPGQVVQVPVTPKPGPAAPVAKGVYPLMPTRPGETQPRAPAGALNRTLSVKYAGTTISDVCEDLSAKAGLPVTHIGTLKDRKVTCTADQATLRKVLDDISAQLGSQVYESWGGFRFRGKVRRPAPPPNVSPPKTGAPDATPPQGGRYPQAPTGPGAVHEGPPAGAADKEVSVAFDNASLAEVCAELTKQTGVPVTCIGVFAQKKVTYAADKATLGKVLDAIAAQIGSKLYERGGGFRFRRPD